MGSSKVVPLEQGKFYGHLSGLVTLAGMTPESEELKFEHWEKKIRKGAVWLPHGKIANSPGHPAWDVTGGKFGGFQGQMFMGDQTLSTLFRVVTEKVDGNDQGCVVPFARGLSSGVMRPCFLPDGSLLFGQTGRGWRSRGGQEASLQQVVWDGKTVAADIDRVSLVMLRSGSRWRLISRCGPSRRGDGAGNSWDLWRSGSFRSWGWAWSGSWNTW